MYDYENITMPETIEEAIDYLMEQPESIIICGGSDVLIGIRSGKLRGKSLVSIRDIKALKGITINEEGTIIIGPAMTFCEVTEHPVIKEHIPTLGEAADMAGGPQLRNIGTIGGNICNGVTSADTAPALLTLNALLEITGSNGKREVLQKDFYKGPGKVDLEQGEMLTAIKIRKEDYLGFTGHYIKYAMRNAMDIATLGCAVHVKIEGEHIEDVRLAFGVAAPTPIRCDEAEERVKKEPINKDTIKVFGEVAADSVSPRTSWRATKEFRLQLVTELSRRALLEALGKGGVSL